MKYVLVDTANTFFRARHVVRGELDIKVGMAFHITFNSLKKAWNDFDADHIVFCLEGRSWRKDFYEPYKANRKVLMDSRTPKEQEDDELYFEAYDDMVNFFVEKTNMSVIRCETAEADDMIARWIQLHPDVDHVIVSSDSDFYQLLNNNDSFLILRRQASQKCRMLPKYPVSYTHLTLPTTDLV